MSSNHVNQLLKGALLLSLAGLLSKLLGAAYRIPLQNMTGDIGFYIYQQIYPILGMATVLALYGFPSAISRLVAGKGDNQPLSLYSFYIPVFLILSVFSISMFLLLYTGADELAASIGDIHLATAYKVAACSFLFLPPLAIFRGISQGQGSMKGTAYSQVGEQFVRVLVIICAAAYVGITGEVYEIGSFAGVAAIAGAITAIVISFFFMRKHAALSFEKAAIDWRQLIEGLLVFGIVAGLNHMLLLTVQLADAFTLLPYLQEADLNRGNAMEAKGIYDRGIPLIQLGTVLGSSIALALVPSVSNRQSRKKQKSHIRSAILISFYIAFGATAGLIVIFPEANVLLYQDAKGTNVLQVLSMSIFLTSMAITIAALMQSLGKVKRTAGYVMLAFVLKLLLNALLVPAAGTMGAAVATVGSLGILLLILLLDLKRYVPELALRKTVRWKPLIIATAVMVSYLLIVDMLIDAGSRLSLLIYVVGVSVTGAVIYGLLLVLLGAFTEEELRLLPKSTWLLKVYKWRNEHE